MSTETRDSGKSHKYLSIAEHLRRQIHDGELKAGDRLPKFSEMKSLFGATPTTVERVYSLLESEKLVVRENGVGIFVAQPQVSPLKSAIAICGQMPLMEYSGAASWSILTEGVREVTRRYGQTLSLCEEIHPGIADQTDGLILITHTWIERILERVPATFPMVSLVIPRKGILSVISDDTGGQRLAVEHLLSLGHRRIATLNDGGDGLQAFWRLESYRATLRAAGIEPREEWVRYGNPEVVINNYLEWGRNKMKQWLAEDWKELGCTAIAAQNDEMAVGAMQVLQEAGYRIPEDISIVGFDSTIWCDLVTPTLTSVEVPFRQMSVMAAEILQEQILGERKPGMCGENKAENILLPTRLVIRQSTGQAPH